jgi:hypothetical protein
MPTTQEIEQSELLDLSQTGEVEFAIFELIDRQPSTWLKKGTEELPEDQQVRKDAPGVRKILNVSAYATDVKKNKEGKIIGYNRVETKYIFGAAEIATKKLAEDSTAIPSPEDDQIVFINGRLIVANDGGFKSKFKFMKEGDSRNETNPNRIPSVDAVYREVFPEKEKEVSYEKEFAISKAITKVEELVDRDKNGYTYNENKLNAFCKLFGVSAESNGGKVVSLLGLAKADPFEFLDKVRIFEQQVYQEIASAIDLGLIELEPNRATYVGKNEIITTYSDKLSNEKKIRYLADFFNSEEGREQYELFKIEFEYKKEQALKN